MKKLLLITLSSLGTVAMATGYYDSEINPVYINLNTGVATGYSFTTRAQPDQPSGSSTNNYSLGANVGYNINQYIATEIGYNHLWLGGTSINPSGQVGIEDIAVKGSLPLGNVFSLYGRAGLGGYQNVSGSNSTSFANNIGVLYGAGAQWALSKQWAFNAEYWSVSGLGENIVQFGAQFSF